MEAIVEHILAPEKPMVKNTITYQWKSSAQTKMYVIVGHDEYGGINSMIVNVGSSGTTIHNVVNALGRVISIALRDDMTKALDIVQTMEDVSSEVVWRHDKLGEAQSIPGVLALILLRHIEIEGMIEQMHSGEEEE